MMKESACGIFIFSSKFVTVIPNYEIWLIEGRKTIIKGNNYLHAHKHICWNESALPSMFLPHGKLHLN